jgi:hypothetical protein
MPPPAAFSAVPDWFSQENQGADTAVADVTGSGRPDLVVMMVDGPQLNRCVYRVGRDLDGGGVVTGGWTPWIDVPDWFSWENQGAGIDVADLTGSGRRPDLVVFAVDNPPGRNDAFYRVGTDLGPDAVTANWSIPLGVNNWVSWENQGAGADGEQAAADPGHGLVHHSYPTRCNAADKRPAFADAEPRGDAGGAKDVPPGTPSQERTDHHDRGLGSPRSQKAFPGPSLDQTTKSPVPKILGNWALTWSFSSLALSGPIGMLFETDYGAIQLTGPSQLSAPYSAAGGWGFHELRRPLDLALYECQSHPGAVAGHPQATRSVPQATRSVRSAE